MSPQSRQSSRVENQIQPQEQKKTIVDVSEKLTISEEERRYPMLAVLSEEGQRELATVGMVSQMMSFEKREALMNWL